MAPHEPLAVSHINNLQMGEEEEQKGNIDKAIQYYEEAIKDEKADEVPYNRLMILYRKEKKYKDELRVINKGIKVFTDFYKKSTAERGKGKKLSDLSEAFMKSAGLKDNKGQLVYQPEPIGKWTKRKEVAQGKLDGPRARRAEVSSEDGRKKALPAKSAARAKAKPNIQGSKTKKASKSKGKSKSKK